MKKGTLEEQLANLENLYGETEKSIKGNAESIEATERRLEAAQKKVSELEQRYESGRRERQRLLAKGNDSQKINALIRSIRDEIEVTEDEVIGLDMKLEELSREEESLKKEFMELKEEFPKTKLIHLAKQYNEIAPRLAKIVQAMWEQKYELNETRRGSTVISHVGWVPNALSRIPKLFFPEEAVPADIMDKTFFDIGPFDEEKKREAEALKKRG